MSSKLVLNSIFLRTTQSLLDVCLNVNNNSRNKSSTLINSVINYNRIISNSSNQNYFTQFRGFSTTGRKMVLAKKFTFAKVFEGQVKESDFSFEEEELPQLQNGEFIVEALFLSVDPYMRAYYRTYKLGQVMIGEQVAKVIESRNSSYKVGTNVVGNFGWRSHTLVGKGNNYNVYALPDIGDLSPSLGIGALGMPGNTAYFGFLEICQPKSGETVVVTGAAGAVGNHVGQIALIKGCTVIGIAGSPEKCKWLKSLGFHHAINYKDSNWVEQFYKAAPNGVDCYFDNVGGEMSSVIINKMNLFGRISVCGSISSYEDAQLPKATILQPSVVMKQLKMEGFIVTRFMDRWFEGISQNLKWIKEGKLKFRESYTTGFENMPKALIDMFKGENIGKSVVSAKASNVETHSHDFKSTLESWKEK